MLHTAGDEITLQVFYYDICGSFVRLSYWLASHCPTLLPDWCNSRWSDLGGELLCSWTVHGGYPAFSEVLPQLSALTKTIRAGVYTQLLLPELTFIFSGGEGEPWPHSGHHYEDLGEKERPDQLHWISTAHGCRWRGRWVSQMQVCRWQLCDTVCTSILLCFVGLY